MIRKALFSTALVCMTLVLHAQETPNRLIVEVKNYNKLLKERNISESDYFKNVDSLLNSFFTNYNGFLTHDSLLNLLELYREKAITKGEKYPLQKIRYYFFLATNADIRGKGGQAIYFAEKMTTEMKKKGRKSITKIILEANNFSRYRNFLKVTELHEKERLSLLQYQKLFLNKKLSTGEILDIIAIHRVFFSAYLRLEDYTNSEKIIKLIDEMIPRINEQEDVSLKLRLHALLYLNSMKIEFLSAKGKSVEALQILQSTENRIKENKENLKDEYAPLEDILKELRMNYLFSFSPPEQALKLLDSTTRNKVVSQYDSIQIQKQRAYLLLKKGDYRSAYTALKGSLDFQEEEYITLTNEMDELLYSHSEAEQNRLELLDSEKEKKNRNLIYSLVIALVSTFSIALAIYYYKEKKRFKRTIDDLNNTTEIQIEEAKNRATFEEKVKLGQNLHDDMSGTLAGMLRLIETIEDNTKEKNTAKNLGLLYVQTENIYSSVRTKSHQMYNETDYFEESVKKIVNTALHHYGYKTEVEIDNSLALTLSTSLRIELLRIIQESVTNILKHAKKATEAFVFMFKQGDSIFLQIGDNGVSQKISSTEGIGLKSIAARVNALHGELSIENTKGTILSISFPLS